jgi:hypothetical protein
MRYPLNENGNQETTVTDTRQFGQKAKPLHEKVNFKKTSGTGGGFLMDPFLPFYRSSIFTFQLPEKTIFLRKIALFCRE